MPFKHNAARRHRIPRARYKVTNWSAYEAGLRRRGDLTFWVDEAALAGWLAPRRSTPGGHGESLQPGLPGLMKDEVDAYPHRSVVNVEGGGSVPGQVWLLSDDATYLAIPLSTRAAALSLIAAGKGVVLLARSCKAEARVLEGLLEAMDQFAATPVGST